MNNFSFYKEKAFRETSIGNVPEDWEVASLGNRNVATIIMGQSPPSSRYNKEGIGLPFLQGKAEFGQIYPSPSVYCAKPIKIAEKNDVLLSVRAPVGDVNIAPSKCCIGRGVSSIRAKSDRLDYRFLFFYLAFGKKRFESLSMGSTFGAIRKEEIQNYKIPLPPLLEQQGIAEAISSVYEAIKRTDDIIEKTETLRRGLAQDLLINGIGHKKFKDTEIGKIPKDWQSVRLGAIARLESGGTPSRKESTFWNGNIPWLKSGELNDAEIHDTEEKITELGLKKSAAKIFPKGTLLIALYGRGTVGKTAILGIDASTNQAIGAIIPRGDSFEPKFLQYCLVFFRQRLLNQLVNPSSDVGRTNIYLGTLKLFRIPLPQISEQQKIAQIFSIVDKKLQLERKGKAKLERIRLSLMDLILSGKIRTGVSQQC